MINPVAPSLIVASIDQIRSYFPALDRRHNSQPVAYFDGPGGTQVPRSVVQAMTDYLYLHNANTHWSFPSSQETDEIIAGARLVVADFLNAKSEEVVFGNNMTTLTFQLAQSLGRGMSPGDEVLVTELDHHANIDPWHAMAGERGVKVRTIQMVPAEGQINWEDLRSKFTDRTKLLAIGAASNALGTITDVAQAARIAHDAGALIFVDAVHLAPHQLVDVNALDCDFLACSAYKFHGPHLGILYGRSHLLSALDVPKLRPAPDTTPERLETGTQNHEGIAGAAAAIDFIAGLAEGVDRRCRLKLAYQSIHARTSALVDQLWWGLNDIPGVTLVGPPPSMPRTPTVSFVLKGSEPIEVSRHLASRGIFVSHGDFYASTVVQRLGCSPLGLIRVGCACYTTSEEVHRLLETIQELNR